MYIHNLPLPTNVFLSTTIQMASTSNQTTNPSISNLTSIFEVTAEQYKHMTKKDLHTHPFAAQIDTCDSPGAVLDVFRNQAQAFDEFRRGDDKLIRWLGPTVDILFTFSETIGEGLALVVCLDILRPSVLLLLDACFSAFLSRKNDICRDRTPPHGRSFITFLVARMRNIGHSQAAKDVVASHDTLVNLFERIQFFLLRLNIYNGIPLTTDMTALFGKIMAHVLSILAISTKEMSQSRISESISCCASIG